MKNSPAIYVISLGCAKNLVDTEVMCGGLITAGFLLAEDEEDADIVLVNTCGFIRDAKDESMENIEWALEWKEEKPGRKVVVAGCLAQRSPQALIQKYPGIDLLAGLDEVGKLPELMKGLFDKDRTGRHIPAPGLPQYLYDHNSPRLSLTPPTFGYVKVAEGCDHRCAYCAIPLIRGNQRSRTPESVETECRQLLAQGVNELNFIAQDTSRYGTDIGQNLENLLRRCDQIEGDYWIRVLYTHPLHLTDGLLDVLAHSRHVVPYLDIPLQHISTPVLAAMKRGMDGDKTRKLLERIRKKYPEMTIRTTFLVGFPGETEAQFEELLDFVREIHFDRLGAFAFSPEEGTPAFEMPDAVPAEVAEERKRRLLEIQKQISLENNRRWKGRTVRVLLEDSESRRKWSGRSMADAPDVDQTIAVQLKKGREPEETGFVDVQITGAGEYTLSGVEVIQK